MKLTEKQARELIENCGNDDVYYCHYNRGDVLCIEFFPHLGKFISQENVPVQIKEFEQHRKVKKYTNVLVIRNGKAEIWGDNSDKTLVNNVNKYLLEKRKENNEKNI